MKKIYIAGGGGMLGEGMYKIFKDSYNLKCTDIDTNQEWLVIRLVLVLNLLIMVSQ